jgi:hypothetical protein
MIISQSAARISLYYNDNGELLNLYQFPASICTSNQDSVEYLACQVHFCSLVTYVENAHWLDPAYKERSYLKFLQMDQQNVPVNEADIEDVIRIASQMEPSRMLRERKFIMMRRVLAPGFALEYGKAIATKQYLINTFYAPMRFWKGRYEELGIPFRYRVFDVAEIDDFHPEDGDEEEESECCSLI